MQIVLSGNRVVSYGENCFATAGEDVICLDRRKTFPRATIAEVDSVPADIDSVGYEYHAGEFVPCAPFGKGGGGNIPVLCSEDCKSIKDSGYLLPNYSNWKFTASETPLISLIGSPSNSTLQSFEDPIAGSKFAKGGFRALISGTVNVMIRYRTNKTYFVLYMQVDDGAPEILDSNIFHNNTTLNTSVYEISVQAGARYTFYFDYKSSNEGTLRMAEVSIRAKTPDVSTVSDVWSDVPGDVAIYDPIAQLRADVDYIAAQMDIEL